MKVFFRRIHLYLALAAGLVFFVQCLSGTVLVFEEEITKVLHPERYEAAPANGQPRLPLAQLVAGFQQAQPKARILTVKVYRDDARPVEVSFKKNDGKKNRAEGPSGKGGPAHRGGPGGKGRDRGETAFLNPYTGQVQATLDPGAPTFLDWAEKLHRFLLAGDAGKFFTGLSAVFILVITATGLVLWWPKTRRALRGRLRIKWGSSGKRLTHDLHIVLGFYCSLLLFVLAGTGVVMSYRWATQGLFWLTGSQPLQARPLASAYAAGRPTIGPDAALRVGQAAFPRAESWRIAWPRDSAAAVAVVAPSNEPLHRTGLDSLFLDRYSGAVLGQRLYRDQPAGAQIRRYIKPIHTGALGGVPTKILAFAVCLLSLSFPVTGVLLWWSRTKKQRKNGRRVLAGA